MIQLELPHVNILSKIDLIESYGKLSKYIFKHCFGDKVLMDWLSRIQFGILYGCDGSFLFARDIERGPIWIEIQGIECRPM